MYDNTEELFVKEYPRTDPRLGRRLVLDGKSLPFMIERVPVEVRRPLRSVSHERRLAPLDQGDLGSCTTNAGMGVLGTHPHRVLETITGSLDPRVVERFAVTAYQEVTASDSYPGQWPPDDTGSDGLTVCKVFKKHGFIAGYRWASTLHGICNLLLDGPVMLGMPWYEAFFDPTLAGFIDPTGWQSTGIAGGHEIEISGVRLTVVTDDGPDVIHDRGSRYRAVFECWNSWGSSWGLNGRFFMTGMTYQLLRDDCDVKQPLPA